MSNRVIKFRAWDEDRQLMIYEFAEKGWSKKSYRLIFNDEKELFCGNYRDNGDWQEPKLMQFTGLHDKEGKEIYEGDIVKILYTDWPSKSESDNRTLEQYLDDIAHIGIIVFNDSGWEVKFKSKKYPDDFDYSNISPGKHGFIRVIGNVHQHKHLLK